MKMSPQVAPVFDAFPDDVRPGLLKLRALILSVAEDTPEAGQVSEELRWGQPSYLTPKTGAGTTLRLGVPKTGGFALFVHCRTSLMDEFRTLAGPGWDVEGNRAVVFRDDARLNDPALRWLISRALTYHLPAKSTG